jgi:hypothetical protein
MAARFSIFRSSTRRWARDCVCAGRLVLQAEGVDAALSWTLKPAAGGASVARSYVVGGFIRGGMEQWAPRVDRVLDEQLQRLKASSRAKPPRASDARTILPTLPIPARKAGFADARQIFGRLDGSAVAN